MSGYTSGDPLTASAGPPPSRDPVTVLRFLSSEARLDGDLAPGEAALCDVFDLAADLLADPSRISVGGGRRLVDAVATLVLAMYDEKSMSDTQSLDLAAIERTYDVYCAESVNEDGRLVDAAMECADQVPKLLAELAQARADIKRLTAKNANNLARLRDEGGIRDAAIAYVHAAEDDPELAAGSVPDGEDR